MILSEDPTAMDPETLDQLTVVETIKEGRTIYNAGEFGNTDGLAFRPPRDGSDPFAAFLRQAAVARDMEGAGNGPMIRAMRRMAAEAPHDGTRGASQTCWSRPWRGCPRHDDDCRVATLSRPTDVSRQRPDKIKLRTGFARMRFPGGNGQS
nr:hypothetical protein [Thioalkalivibrio nitratireducens]